MFIAFLVLAALALVFLFVYNARNARAAARNPRRKPEPARTNNKQIIQEQLPERKEALGLEKSKNSNMEGKAAEGKQIQQSTGDMAYRDAIRRFAEQGKQAVHQERDHKDRNSPDLSYREALRSMSRSEDGQHNKDK